MVESANADHRVPESVCAYLDALDHFVKEGLRVRHYIRYMDDFLLLASDRSEARDRLDAVRAFLTERLRLEMNPRRVIVANPMDRVSLGHGFRAAMSMAPT